MEIKPISSIDLYTVQKILRSSTISDEAKLSFMRKHKAEINTLVEHKISSSDFKTLMDNRPLIKFRPLKNSYTKAGDKVIIAQALDIQPCEADDYIRDITYQLSTPDGIKNLSAQQREIVKTYVFRHGSKPQVVTYFNYELTHAKDLLTTLYKTLEYNTGGVADYFVRPIHRMDNKTMLGLYNVVDDNLKLACESGNISRVQYDETSRWALLKIYQIQNNSKLRNALKIKQQI